MIYNHIGPAGIYINTLTIHTRACTRTPARVHAAV